MITSETKFGWVLTICIGLSLFCSAVTAQKSDELVRSQETASQWHKTQVSQRSEYEWPGTPPSEIHRGLAAHKFKMLEDTKFSSDLGRLSLSYDAQRDFDVRFYDVYLKINDTTHIITGRVGITSQVLRDDFSELIIDMAEHLTLDSVVAARAMSSDHLGDQLIVTLAETADSADLISFEIYYSLNVDEIFSIHCYFYERNGWSYLCTFSEPYFARWWWPCKDHPSDKPDSMYIEIEIDTALYCASNGTLDSVIMGESNSHNFYYAERFPIATYLFSLEVGRYVTRTQPYYYDEGQKTMPIVNVIYPDQLVEAAKAYSITDEALAVFRDAFGEYPFVEEKYGHAQSLNWGMEHQTMTTIGGSYMYEEWVVVHELAHQWWGNMITLGSWHDFWLNEGFATYSEGIWAEANSGEYGLETFMSNIAYRGGGTVIWQDTANFNIMGVPDRWYHKGAWVLHMLRGAIGDSLFFDGMRAYYDSEFKYASAVTDDFVGIMEQTTGMQLDWFFDQWLYGEYCPNYEYSYTWRPSDSSGWDVYLIVKQIQTTEPALFTMPISLALYYDPLRADTVVAMVDERRELIKLNMPEEIIGIWFDPTDYVLKYSKWRQWEMFIVTQPSDLQIPQVGEVYQENFEIIGGSGDYLFSLTAGSLPEGMELSVFGQLSGSPVATGQYSFEVAVVDNVYGYVDRAWFDFLVGSIPCCGLYVSGYTGNADCSSDGKRNLADITKLIDFVYISKSDACCEENLNVDGDFWGRANLADITRLIDFVYVSKTNTAVCR